jgi:hypothetical protein
VFSGNRHQCPNRSSSNNKKSLIHNSAGVENKSNYYKKSFYSKEPKPKMSNSLELLQGSIADVQQRYEILSDIVSEANGKVHGSQSHIVNNANNSISLIVYYEVSEGQRDAIKQKFNSFVKNLMVLQ